MRKRPAGLTRDAGWQIGASRTMPLDAAAMWDFLVSGEGLAHWLGDVRLPRAVGEAYETADGTAGEVRGYRPGDRVRLTWRPPGRDAPATVQMTVRPATSGCSVRFHSERLTDAEEREAMRAHWHAVLDRIAAAVQTR